MESGSLQKTIFKLEGGEWTYYDDYGLVLGTRTARQIVKEERASIARRHPDANLDEIFINP